MDRRRTMGALQPSNAGNRRHTTFEGSLRSSKPAVRSRQSFAPSSSASSRASMSSKRRQTMMASNTSSARSSVRGRNSQSIGGNGRKSMGGSRQSLALASKKKNADPRPVKKKSFMEQEVKEVIRFLCHHQYDHPITPKQLTKPTAKDFGNIVMYLFSVVDPKYRGGVMKTDVPLFYKGLGYPFTLSPASLCAVGAPNTWPNMLAALSWLIELLSYDEVVSRDSSSPEQVMIEGEHTDKRFFRFLTAQYAAFLSGEDAAFEAQTEEMEQYFDQRNGTLSAEVKSTNDKALMLMDELKSLTEAKSMIPSLKEEVSVLESDIAKYTNYLKDLAAYTDKRKKQLSEGKDALKLKEQHMHELQQKKQRIENTIAKQAFSVHEFQNMRTECSRKRKALQAVQKEKSDVQNEIWDMETRRTAQIEEIEQLTKEYNSFAEKLQLCPSNAKYAGGKNFAAKLHLFDEEKPLISVDLKGEVKPAVKQLIETVTTDAVQVGTDALKLQQRIDEISERLDETKTANKSLKATLDRQEHAISEEKDRLVQDAAEMQKNIDDLRIASAKLTSSDVSQRKEILAQREVLEQLQRTRMAAAEAAKVEEAQLYQQVHRTVQLIAGHEEQQQATLKSFSSALTSSLDALS